jgi:uncharacterized membrane protein
VLLTLGTVAVGALVQLVSALGAHAVSDIPKLWFERGIRPGDPPYLDRPLEYPVLVGLAMWLTSWAPSRAAFLVVNAALLVPLAVVVTLLLERLVGAAAARWAVGVPLALYALHQWDLLAVAPAVAALLAAERGAAGTAGVLLALGTAVKLYPGAFVPLLAVWWWRDGRRREVARLTAAFAGVLLVVNVPVALAAPDGWWHMVSFQGARAPSWGSLWFHLFRLPVVEGLVEGHEAGAANALSLTALVAGLGWLGVLAWQRRLGPFALATAATVVFLLANKIYSPQYDLWLLPSFALLSLDRRLLIAFSAASLAMYLLVFGHAFGLIDRPDLPPFIGTVAVARAVVLVGVLRAATR